MKKFIPIIFILLFFVVICTAYSHKKSLFFNENPIYDQIIKISYNESDVYTFGYVVISKDEIRMGIPYDKKPVHISRFESCLLRDYAANILDLYDTKEENKSDSGVRGLMIDTGNTLDPAYPSGRICRGLKGDIKTNLFVCMALTMYYLRSLLPIIAAVYLIFIIIGHILRKKENISHPKIFYSPQIVFLILSIILTVALDSLFSTEKIYWLLIRQQFFFPLIPDKTNLVIGIIMLIVESLILFMIYKDLSICRLYAIPYIIQMLIHKVIFKGESMRSGIAGNLRQIIGFSEIFPIYPEFIWFTLFFVIGAAIYFVFGSFANKNVYKNFCTSTVFSICCALLMCMTSYAAIHTIRSC